MTKSEAKTARKPRRMAREPKQVGRNAPASASNDGAASNANDTSLTAALPAPSTKLEKAASKASLVLGMLRQPEGATLEQMVAATGWRPHTTRAVLTGFKKKSHTVTSEKANGVRTYWVDRTTPADVADSSTEKTQA